MADVNADLLSLVVFQTPAGTREGGVLQPAYLNFDAALLEPPANELKVRTLLVSFSTQKYALNGCLSAVLLNLPFFKPKVVVLQS